MTETLTPFEEIIIEKMIEYQGCRPEEARNIILKYLPVIRLIDDDHDSARNQARRYYDAFQKGIDPGLWIKKIHRVQHAYDSAKLKQAKAAGTTDPQSKDVDLKTELMKTLKQYPQSVVHSVISELYPNERVRIHTSTPYKKRGPRYNITETEKNIMNGIKISASAAAAYSRPLTKRQIDDLARRGIIVRPIEHNPSRIVRGNLMEHHSSNGGWVEVKTMQQPEVQRQSGRKASKSMAGSALSSRRTKEKK